MPLSSLGPMGFTGSQISHARFYASVPRAFGALTVVN